MTSKTMKWILCIIASIVIIMLLLYLYTFIMTEGFYAYKYTNCKALHWNYPVHKFDTLSGKEWNSLRIYDVNSSKLEELLAFAEMNAWKLLPLTDIEKDDSFLKDYPDQNISLMKEAQTGYWKRGEGYLCIFDAESATLYIRSSSIIE